MLLRAATRAFSTASPYATTTLAARLAQAEARNTPLIMAEGFVFELERRGFLQMGPWSPVAILDEPDVFKQLHRETLRAGTDIAVACTYYAHPEKLRLIGRTNALEEINRRAVRIAKQAVEEEGMQGDVLIAGNICNTNIWEPGNADRQAEVRSIFQTCLSFAESEGVDLILGETFTWTQEAIVAVEECHKVGLPAVINMAIHEHGKTLDGDSVPECFRKLKAVGAEVVGLNCFRGPETTLPLLAQARAEGVAGPFAAVPMGYRTGGCSHGRYETHWQMIKDSATPGHFQGLEQHLCDRQQWAQFALDAQALGSIGIIGTCCGGWVHHVRAMSEALGRTVNASKYSPDMEKHTFLGSDERLSKGNLYQNIGS